MTGAIWNLLLALAWVVLGGDFSGVNLVVGLVFGYITEMRLLELANLNHPALKELIVQAPGTYHHSMVVGSLAEAAAEAIHAGGLFGRGPGEGVMKRHESAGDGQNHQHDDGDPARLLAHRRPVPDLPTAKPRQLRARPLLRDLNTAVRGRPPRGRLPG